MPCTQQFSFFMQHMADAESTFCVAFRMAAERPDVPFMLLDVEASAANRALAMEKTLTKPTSQRRGAKPILRQEAKFPAFSIHLAPSMQPLQLFTGPSTALKQLAAALKDTPLNAPISSARTQRKVSAALQPFALPWSQLRSKFEGLRRS